MRLGGPAGATYVPITEAEWRAGIAAVDGLRVAAAGAVTTNARTGEVIQLWHERETPRLDAEVALDDGVWKPLLRWHASGHATVPVDFDPGDPDEPETRALLALAGHLGATVIDPRDPQASPTG